MVTSPHRRYHSVQSPGIQEADSPKSIRYAVPKIIRYAVPRSIRYAVALTRTALACLVPAFVGLAGCAPSEADIGSNVQVVRHDDAQRVDVLIDGDLFTSYVYSDTLTVLKKPVLYPIRTSEGKTVTRGYPIDPVVGERVDHPHHIGLWFNYGNVNGLDFWNNSSAVSPDRADEMGIIRHAGIEETESGEGEGAFVASSEWVNSEGNVLLHETTRFVFRGRPDVRIIDRVANLRAGEQAVTFEDNKEGMLGLRVTRALEIPSDRPTRVVGPAGDVIESADPYGASGVYLNSEGISGYPDVWGKRARWMTLAGDLEDDSVTVAILDHPSNVGFPTYWHARDYGLFAANPLGQAVFSEGEERLNYALAPGESTTFRYRLVVYDGKAAADEVERWYDEFAASSL